MLYSNIGAASSTSTKPTAFSFDENCSFTAIVQDKELPDVRLYSHDGNLFISGLQNKNVSLYNMNGEKIYQALILKDPAIIYELNSGIYIVSWDENQARKVYVN
jgi:hypothetical protein